MDEQLEKAKKKQIEMQKKITKATNLSKKHNAIKKTEEESIKKPKPIDYLFEMSEQLIESGFDDNEVSNYMSMVENYMKQSEVYIFDRVKTLEKEIRKLNKTLNRIDNNQADNQSSTTEIQQENDMEKEHDGQEQEKVGVKSSFQNQSSLSYVDIARYRQNPEKRKENLVNKFITPKKPKGERKKLNSEKKSDHSNEPYAVEATGAGTNFLSMLAEDVDGYHKGEVDESDDNGANVREEVNVEEEDADGEGEPHNGAVKGPDE